MEEQETKSVADTTAVDKKPKCGYAWGNCKAGLPSSEPMRAFGQPSRTPHLCGGGVRHPLRMHYCEACKVVGTLVKPSPFSKAGIWYKQQLDKVNAELRRKAEADRAVRLMAESMGIDYDAKLKEEQDANSTEEN